MPARSSSLNSTLPQSYYLRNDDNHDKPRRCIYDAKLAANNPDVQPAERHLHRIVAGAALQLLYHSRNRQEIHARGADRLVNDAIRQLENIRLEAVL